MPTAVEEYAVEPIDQQEVFDHVRDIKDLEHPYSLEELKVITEDAIEIDDQQSYVRITFTPTVEHFSMATIIGLCLRVKLLRSLPSRYKVDIRVAPGSHASEFAAMDSNSSSTLVLCGKSTAENEIAVSLKSNKTLKLPGDSEVSVLLKSELEENSFRIDSYMASLSTSQFGRFLIWSPRLPSTHDVVSHNFGELPLGTVCVADVQFKGRGRSKNVWESPMGCLMFSFTTQMEDGRVVPLVQYVVSLAITEAIKDVCDKNGLPCIDVKIKWPNDLYLNGLKVGGILCTSTYRSKKFNVSAGIGLNVDNEKPTTCLNAVLKELSVVAYQLSREEILAAFFEKFEKFNDLFINQGFQTLEELYYKTWLHSGQRVIVQEKNEDQMVENVVTIQGLTSSGYLLAIGDDNQMYELHPDGNSLDFFKGLIRRKLD